MPLFIKDNQGNETVEHRGEVVAVRKYRAQRNVSDTLDYSDYQQVDVTEALVYRGRTKEVWDRDVGHMVTKERSVEERFEWQDCSNLFVWRGASTRVPVVDDICHPDVVIDHIDYVVAHHEIEARRVVENARIEEERVKANLEREKNRPVKGKKMVVVSGRKVKPGTIGVVAFIHDSGRILLKDSAVWQDRKASGVWVDGRHLKASLLHETTNVGANLKQSKV